jgi:alpha-tubulin suppressor-like RCC1 family protein
MSDEYSIITKFREGPDEGNIDLGAKFLTKNKFISYFSRFYGEDNFGLRIANGGIFATGETAYDITIFANNKTSFVPCIDNSGMGLTNLRWKQAEIGDGANHTLYVLDRSGLLWVIGENQYGQLGDGTTTDGTSLYCIDFSNIPWKQISANWSYITGIKTDGTLWSWGGNSYGQLGQNNRTHRSSPTQIGTGTDWKYVSAGGAHVAAIKTNGTLWTWGYNYIGQLGQNNITDRSSPTQVGTATNWKQVSAGDMHTAAIKTDGTLWTWGWNEESQLGLNNYTNRSSPTQVGTATNWKKVSAGSYNTGIIKTDNTLWGCGQYSTFFGDEYISMNTPIQIGTGTDWNQISVNFNNMMGIKTDGTLWAAGNASANYKGNIYKLGISCSIGSNITLQQIGTNTNWVSVSGGLNGSGYIAIADLEEDLI